MATPAGLDASAKATQRVPPSSEDAERGVLGSALLDASRVIDLCISRQITSESFYVQWHRVLFEQLVSMQNEGPPVDLLTVSQRLRDLSLLDQVGGNAYLEKLIDGTPTAAHAEYYIDIVRQKHLLRAIIDRSREAIDACYSGEDDAGLRATAYATGWRHPSIRAARCSRMAASPSTVLQSRSLIGASCHRVDRQVPRAMMNER